MVDNFALIRDFMKFEDPDHFYFLQILQSYLLKISATAYVEILKLIIGQATEM